MSTQNQNYMKILIAPDKFKGSLTSSQAAVAIREGVEQAYAGRDTELEFRTVEIADGGDGSLEVLQKKVPGARILEVMVHDPLGREVSSQVLLYRMQSSSAGAEKGANFCPREEAGGNVAEKETKSCQGEGVRCAFIEMAKVSGLEMLSKGERNPLHTSTYGMGEAIKAAVAHGATEITLSIGGSATNDGGAGMLQALGYRFFDAEGVEIPSPIKGGQLGQIASIAAGGFLVQNSTIGQPVPESDTYLAQNSVKQQSVPETNTFLVQNPAAVQSVSESAAFQAQNSANEQSVPESDTYLAQNTATVQPVPESAAFQAQNSTIGQSVPGMSVFQGPGTDGVAAGGAGAVRFKVICDVTNPLLGPQGATAVYGPQKGADAEALKILEAGLANYAQVAQKSLGVPESCKEFPGAGAAGGVGYAGLAFLGAELIPGWKFFARITSLEESVQWADLVITGEGSLDSQSLSGKVVSGVLNLAAQYDKEVAIFCGVSKLSPEDMEAVERVLPKGVRCYSIASMGYPLDICMSQAARLLQELTVLYV